MNETQSDEMVDFLKKEHHEGKGKAGANDDEGPDPESFKISGIFYVDENTWTVWINGEAYSTIGQQKDFSIDGVNEDFITLTLNDGKTITMPITMPTVVPPPVEADK
jgi:hypothetical protein